MTCEACLREASSRVSHRRVARGAVSGNRLKARSWTVRTRRRLRVGGGTKFGAKTTSNRTIHSSLGTSSRSARRSNHLDGIGIRRSTRFGAGTSSNSRRLGTRPSAARTSRYHATNVVSGATLGSRLISCHV